MHNSAVDFLLIKHGSFKLHFFKYYQHGHVCVNKYLDDRTVQNLTVEDCVQFTDSIAENN